MIRVPLRATIHPFNIFDTEINVSYCPFIFRFKCLRFDNFSNACKVVNLSVKQRESCDNPLPHIFSFLCYVMYPKNKKLIYNMKNTKGQWTTLTSESKNDQIGHQMSILNINK